MIRAERKGRDEWGERKEMIRGDRKRRGDQNRKERKNIHPNQIKHEKNMK